MAHFIYAFIYQWPLEVFPPLGFCESRYYEHICASIFLGPCLQSLGYTPRGGMAGSYDNSILTF
jgi:hypothetical protein